MRNKYSVQLIKSILHLLFFSLNIYYFLNRFLGEIKILKAFGKKRKKGYFKMTEEEKINREYYLKKREDLRI